MFSWTTGCSQREWDGDYVHREEDDHKENRMFTTRNGCLQGKIDIYKERECLQGERCLQGEGMFAMRGGCLQGEELYKEEDIEV